MHHNYMNLALELAQKGLYTVSPNPMVGCVIVKDNHIIGQGFHQQAGGHHAEILALQQAGEKAKQATVYLTLEPCCHQGRTPPCTLALIKAGIKKVVLASLDPNPLVSGKGIEALRAANIAVEIGLLENQAQALNEVFFHFMKHTKPFVFAKWAMSLDGKTKTQADDSKQISCTQAREHSHYLRQQVDAILIGCNTAIQDNPLLTARNHAHPLKQPLRIILSSHTPLPLNLNIFDPQLPGKTLVVTTQAKEKIRLDSLKNAAIETWVIASNESGKVNLQVLMTELGKIGITSLLVEGGMTILHDFFKENLVNKINVYIATTIIANQAIKTPVSNVSLEKIADNFFLSGDL